MQNCRRKALDKIVSKDRQTAMAILVYPLHFVVGGIITFFKSRLIKFYQQLTHERYVCDRTENFVGNGENAGKQHVLMQMMKVVFK